MDDNASNSDSPSLSEAEFANLFQERLKQAGDPRETVFDADEFRLVFMQDGERQGVLNLANMFQEYTHCQAADRETYLSRMVRSAFSHLKELPEEFVDAAYDLRPKIWTRSTIDLINLRNKLEGEPPLDWPCEQIGDHLILSLVYDLPESVRSLSSEDLETWDVSFWEAREKAVENLAEIEFECVSLGDELFASTTQDSYDATRMILPGLFEQFPVNGRPIVMVPNRESLLFSGMDSEVGMRMMIEFASQQMWEQPRPMIGTPLVLADDGVWEDWLPDPSHPLFKEFQTLKVSWLRSEYEAQQPMLEELLENKGNMAIAMDYQATEHNSIYRGYAVWAVGIPSLLPETDWIALVEPDTQELISICDFEILKSLLPSKIEKSEQFYPFRYLATGRPSDNIIGKAALDVAF